MGKREVKTTPKDEHLPFQLDYVPEDLKQIAEKYLGETEETKETGLAELRQLVTNEPGLLIRMDANFLLQFLRIRKYDVPKAFQTIQSYYKFKKKFSRIYEQTDNTKVYETIKKNFFGFLPYRSERHNPIGIARIEMWDPEELTKDLIIWIASHAAVHVMENQANQIAGFIAIIDVRGVKYKHFRELSMDNIFLLHDVMLKCFPGRVAHIHVVGMTPFFSTVWKIAYPFLLSMKMLKRVHIHGNDMTSLHEHISPAILPSEFGGELGPFDNSWWHAMMLEKNDWILQHRFYGYQN